MKEKAKDLWPETLRWVQQVTADFVLEAHHSHLLQLAAESWDRTRECREILSRDGLTITDRYGVVKPSPFLAVEEKSRMNFSKLLRELNLDSTPAEPRPPEVRQTSGRRKR